MQAQKQQLYPPHRGSLVMRDARPFGHKQVLLFCLVAMIAVFVAPGCQTNWVNMGDWVNMGVLCVGSGG